MEANERPIADEVLTAVPIPDYGKVQEVPVLTLRGGGGAWLMAVRGSGAGVPEATRRAVGAALEPGFAPESVWAEWSHVESAFLTGTPQVGGGSNPGPSPAFRTFSPYLCRRGTSRGRRLSHTNIP